MFYRFGDYIPVVHPSSFVHPQASITGHVIIGRDVYIGPGAAIRGDWGGIEIKDGCNIQENCIIHQFPGVRVVLEEGSHMGHGSIVHGAYLGKNCLIGMGAVIMDKAIIGAESIIGALAFVKTEMDIPARSLVVGNPARIIKQVSDEMIKWKTEGTRLYQELPEEMRNKWKTCEPLTEVPDDLPAHEAVYLTWKEIKKNNGK
jgi:phenylacetic acid degradation protein/carnitine operon protein CaiE